MYIQGNICTQLNSSLVEAGRNKDLARENSFAEWDYFDVPNGTTLMFK